MTTLTDRYVHEVARRIPARQRDDVAAELRATIADTIDARGDDAEREVLNEMGDPMRLAARYADRPLALIGPELYPSYIRLFRVLVMLVLPIVTIVLMALEATEANDIGQVIGAGVGAVLNVGGQMIAWLTVIYALIERYTGRDALREELPAWTVDQLPPKEDPKEFSVGSYAEPVFTGLVLLAIVWQQIATPYRAGDENLAVLDPQLWTGWIWPILAGLAVMLLVELVHIARRAWTMPLLAGYALGQLLFTLPLAWVLHRQLFLNPSFLAHVNGDRIPDVAYDGTALVVLVVGGYEVFSRWRKVRRKGR